MCMMGEITRLKLGLHYFFFLRFFPSVLLKPIRAMFFFYHVRSPVRSPKRPASLRIGVNVS